MPSAGFRIQEFRIQECNLEIVGDKVESGYRGLMVYQKAYECVLEIYRETNAMPKSETFGLTSQIRRASVSVTTNISEGYGKKEYSPSEYKRFLFMSIGSVNEIMTLADICTDVGYMPKEFKENIRERYEEIRNMLFGIANKL